MITRYRGGGRFTSDYEIARIMVAGYVEDLVRLPAGAAAYVFFMFSVVLLLIDWTRLSRQRSRWWRSAAE